MSWPLVFSIKRERKTMARWFTSYMLNAAIIVLVLERAKQNEALK